MGVTVVMRKRGAITLPARIREKYNLEEGTPFTVIDLGGGAVAMVPKTTPVFDLADEIEKMRTEAGVTLEALLEGLREERG